jgi:hypothetical protein
MLTSEAEYYPQGEGEARGEKPGRHDQDTGEKQDLGTHILFYA